MKILGIETSCDDTGIAILEIKDSGLKILSNIVSSQVKLHAKYGGVYPTLAKREHQKNLPIVLKKALKEARNPKINLVAVTVGPGLEPCLWVGVNFAKELAKKLKVPIVPTDHMEGHILANFIGESKIQNPKSKNIFPAIALAVSGGHTQLILMKGIGKYKILGETRDDAAGECFDKTARILGLPYPGGPTIAAEAAKFLMNLKRGNKFQSSFRSPAGTVPSKAAGRARTQTPKSRWDFEGRYFETSLPSKLPRPMIHQKNYDFSFSGLKTAVLYNWRSQPQKIRKSKEYIQAMASEIQQAIIDVLIHKTLKAAKEFKAKTIILGGGVAANIELRKQFNQQLTTHNLQLNFFVPQKNWCTDNGAMIAAAGYYKWSLRAKLSSPVSPRYRSARRVRSKEKVWRNIEADANLRLE